MERRQFLEAAAIAALAARAGAQTPDGLTWVTLRTAALAFAFLFVPPSPGQDNWPGFGGDPGRAASRRWSRSLPARRNSLCRAQRSIFPGAALLQIAPKSSAAPVKVAQFTVLTRPEK